MIALDTTALIDFYKNNTDLKNLLEGLDDILVTSIVNYQEIMFGLNPKYSKYKLEKDFYESFFNNIIILDFDKGSADKTSEIYWNLVSKGKLIGEFDSMIAGCFLSSGVNSIITKN